MQTIAWRLLGAAALIALSAPAGAQFPSQAQSNAIRQACRADYQSHCASVPTGGSAALQCLQQNAASLSAPCQEALSAGGAGASSRPATSPPATAQSPNTQSSGASTPMSPRAEMAMLRTDCRADYRRFCADVRPGGGRAIGCLQAHEQQ